MLRNRVEPKLETGIASRKRSDRLMGICFVEMSMTHVHLFLSFFFCSWLLSLQSLSFHRTICSLPPLPSSFPSTKDCAVCVRSNLPPPFSILLPCNTLPPPPPHLMSRRLFAMVSYVGFYMSAASRNRSNKLSAGFPYLSVSPQNIEVLRSASTALDRSNSTDRPSICLKFEMLLRFAAWESICMFRLRSL